MGPGTGLTPAPHRPSQQVQLVGMVDPDRTKRRGLEVLFQLGRESPPQLALQSPLLDLISGRSHHFSEHSQSLSASFFIS